MLRFYLKKTYSKITNAWIHETIHNMHTHRENEKYRMFMCLCSRLNLIYIWNMLICSQYRFTSLCSVVTYRSKVLRILTNMHKHIDIDISVCSHWIHMVLHNHLKKYTHNTGHCLCDSKEEEKNKTHRAQCYTNVILNASNKGLRLFRRKKEKWIRFVT